MCDDDISGATYLLPLPAAELLLLVVQWGGSVSCESPGVGVRVCPMARRVRGPPCPMWVGRGTGTVVQMAAGGCLSSPPLDAAVTPSSGEAPHYCCLATHTCMVNRCDQRWRQQL